MANSKDSSGRLTEETAALVEKLVDVRRRIDNMYYLVGFQEKKRNEIEAQLRETLGRTEVRRTFIDFDARRDPSTDRWCVMCQKDIASAARAGRLRLVHVDGAPHAIHIEDAPLLDLGVLSLPPKSEDYGEAVIGLDCAKRLGAGWWRPETPKDKQKA